MKPNAGSSVLFLCNICPFDFFMNYATILGCFLVKNAPFYDKKYKKAIDELGIL